jgi:hypothetical protein
MARLSKEQIADRRKTVWEMLVMGVPQVTIAKTLNVHRNTITNDVRELRKLHREEVKDTDVHETLGDAVAKFDEIFKYAMQEYSTADKAREKAQFLEKAIAAMDKKTRLLVETGVLPKAAQEITGKMIVEGVDVTKASLQELRTLRNRMMSQLQTMSATNRIADKLSEN